MARRPSRGPWRTAWPPGFRHQRNRPLCHPSVPCGGDDRERAPQVPSGEEALYTAWEAYGEVAEWLKALAC